MPDEPSDADWVRTQLMEAAEVRVRRFQELHPFGSTTVAERLVEAELVRPWVTVFVETETLPVRVDATGVYDDADVHLRFYGPQVFGDRVTYNVELVLPSAAIRALPLRNAASAKNGVQPI